MVEVLRRARLDAVTIPLAVLGVFGLVGARTRFAPSWASSWAGNERSAGAFLLLIVLVACTRRRTVGSVFDALLSDRPGRVPIPTRRKLAFAISVQLLVLLLLSAAFELASARPVTLLPIYTSEPGREVLLTLPDLDVLVPFREYVTPLGTQRTAFYRVRTDGDGCRIAPSAPARASGPGALLLVGDSYAFGCHAEFEHTLGGILARAFPDLPVVNASVSGTCSQEYPALVARQRERKRLEPGWLVVTLFTDMQDGDLPRVLARRRFGSYLAHAGFPVGPTHRARLETSSVAHAWFLLDRKLRSWSATWNVLAPAKLDPEFAVDLVDTLRERDVPGYQALISENLLRVRTAAGLPAERVAVLLIPTCTELLHLAEKRRGENPDPARAAFLERAMAFWDGMVAALTREGYLVCDPRRRMEELSLDSGTYPYTVDGHFDARGFEALGAELVPSMLRATGWRPITGR